MKRLCIFVLLSGILSASAQEAFFVIEIDKQKSNSGSLKMSDVFSSIRYIPLKMNAKFPVGLIHEIFVTPEWIFIGCQTTGGGSFLKYSLEGEFVEMIGSRGKGPGEYLAGSEMTIDAVNKLIYVRANYTNSVHVYDYTRNKYLRSFRVENYDRGIKMLSPNLIWFDGECSMRHTPSYYAWRVMDREGKIVKTQKSPYFTTSRTDKKPAYNYTPNTIVWKHGNGFSFMEIITDTVYQADMNLDIRPRFKLNHNALTRQKSNCYLLETPRQVIIRTFNRETKVLSDGYYDKEKQAYYSYRPVIIPGKPFDYVGILNDLDGGYPFPAYSCLSFDDSRWYTYFLPHKLKEYVSSEAFKKAKAVSPAQKEAFRKMADSLEEDDDPVIVIATLKK